MSEQRDPFVNTTQEEAFEVAKQLPLPEKGLIKRLIVARPGHYLVFTYVVETHKDIRSGDDIPIWKFAGCDTADFGAPVPVAPAIPPRPAPQSAADKAFAEHLDRVKSAGMDTDTNHETDLSRVK